MKKKGIDDIYLLGKNLGLNKTNVDKILNNSDKIGEQVYFSHGPHWYPGGRYGTISISEFYFPTS